MARAVVVDILWSAAVAVVHTYIITVYALSGVVVRLLVSNGLPVAVGDGCYRAAEDVGRILDTLDNHSVGIANGDDSISEDVGLVCNLLDTATKCIGYGDDGIAQNIDLDSIYTGNATIVVGVFNYLITKNIGIATTSILLCGGVLAHKSYDCQYEKSCSLHNG